MNHIFHVIIVIVVIVLVVAIFVVVVPYTLLVLLIYYLKIKCKENIIIFQTKDDKGLSLPVGHMTKQDLEQAI